ncbi:hypothetical protein [Kitasatospora sp. NPDC018619]|uniref:hypothetical protein n=1 Tax=unclassified Kitasatospora TaxID=2633591 RepID=UPI0037AEF467
MPAAFITPVPEHRQRAARRSLAAGRRTDALKALRAESDLPLAHAPAAPARLADRALPVTAEDAAAVPAAGGPGLREDLRGLLGAGRRAEAVRLRRSATGGGLDTGQRIAARLVEEPA